MKKIMLLTMVMILSGCSILPRTSTTGIVEEVTGCDTVSKAKIYLNDNRVFYMDSGKCNLLIPGAEIEFEYGNNMFMRQVKFVEKGEN